MTIRDVHSDVEYSTGDSIPLEPQGLYEVSVSGTELLLLLGTNLEEQLALAGPPVEFTSTHEHREALEAQNAN